MSDTPSTFQTEIPAGGDARPTDDACVVRRREYRTHRVSFRISDSDFQIFCQLSERGGFHSLSGFLRYLAYCAVRAAGGDMTDEIPEGVLRVFKRTYDYDTETLAAAVKLVEAGRVGMGDGEVLPSVEDEVGGMFRELADEGADVPGRRELAKIGGRSRGRGADQLAGVAIRCRFLLAVFTGSLHYLRSVLLERLTIVGLLLERLAICWPLAEPWRVPILGGCAYLYENRRQDRAEQRERGRTREGWTGRPSWRWWTLAWRQAQKGV